MHLLRGRHPALSIGTTLIGIACFASAQAAPPGDAFTGAADDPLVRYQWHVLNQGQAVIGDSRPVAGVDMDVDVLHALHIRGKHVRIGVVDSGLEIRHEDLAANVIPNGSYNFINGSNDPTPSDPGYAHGTKIAGIVAAVGWNGRGGRGIAPEASLVGFAFGEASSITDAGLRYAWGDGPQSSVVDVFNFSFVNVTPFYQDFPLQDQQSWDALMQSTRGGRGAIYVKSAGNSFLDMLGPDQDGNIVDACGDAARANGVGCGLANQDTFNNLFGTIAVASVNAVGKRAAYSSPGSALWISGLGGLNGGYQRAFYPDAAEDPGTVTAPFLYDPAIVTTDLSGCAAGSNVDHDGPAKNALDTSASKIDPLCNYTATASGTSAAAPTVAGVAALMLGVNPNLSARDVKYILATTARQIDPWQPRAVYQGSVIDPGWITNAAGHRFSNWYGFGLADGAAAVYKAIYFTPLPAMRDTQWVVSTHPPSQIGGPARPGTLRIRITQAMKIEAVQLSLRSAHRTPSNLRVVLISPSGTRSVVATPFSTLDPAAYSKTGFYIDLTSSNAFLDESSLGIWTLEVTDMSDPGKTSALNSFSLRIVGH
ncbi:MULTISPECIES: S8 family peptidase [Xanthomonas]|uniref:S8 family serine peptidase n=1 Tax=Xanthomonas dyei TaxID=743699 RepID=A0ABZ0DEF2_9XANT|nr:S8 family peptidase [Xanthomonas dyei]MCC4632434.1 S8 family serine peptidase [Xanthomonas dyei pv. eucalypti]WOB28634.1 S8 family serine peptidase [Xanthomonas dyei]WOB56256.1 S8 family serine peptidase [Xanthomonas dyei]